MKKMVIVDRNQSFSEVLAAALETKLLGWQVESVPLLPRKLHNYQFAIIRENLYRSHILDDLPRENLCLLSIDPKSEISKSGILQLRADLKIGDMVRQISMKLHQQISAAVDNPLLLLNTFEPHLRLKHRSLLLRDYSRQSYRIFYLPLMPLYRIPFALQQTTCDAGIADLLMRLDSGEDCGYQDLFNCFDDLDLLSIPHLNCGVEDLNNLSDSLLHTLVRLFHQLIKNQTDATVGLIETCEMSLRQIKSISMVVDGWYCDVPNNLSYGSKVARREIANIIADLPRHTVFTDISA